MSKGRRRMLIGAVVVAGLLFIGVHVAAYFVLKGIRLPEYDPPEEVVFLDQGWTADDAQWYYHATQGGSMELPIPYAWFIALEQPRVPALLFTEVGRVAEPEYLARFGFLPNERTRYEMEGLSDGWAAPGGLSTVAADVDNNPDNLPVGFVRTRDWLNERTGQRVDAVGFTCAACHTGQLEYEGKALRIEGGPAMTDLGKFRTAVGLSMAMTRYVPGRFRRFADRVLGPDHRTSERHRLKADLEGLLEEGEALKKMVTEKGVYPTTEGFARLDAIGRIGNFVFAEELNTDNFDVSNAPVNFPHIWDTPWLEWVQYNASFSQPMMRNAGEAMGVFASVNFDSLASDEKLFSSTINVVNLHEMETLLSGPAPYEGLHSPEWPVEVFGPLDEDRVAAGRQLYDSICSGCHLPAMVDTAFWDHWTEPLPDSIDPTGRRYLKVKLVNLWDIGTDPNAALNFYRRTVQLGALGSKYKDTLAVGGRNMGGYVTAGEGLPFLIREATEKRYRDIGLPDSLWARFDGYRPPLIQAPLAYKARPLNGVWATAPFLHNGSVPTIHHLLGPVEERPGQFWLGSRAFDPERLGNDYSELAGGFLFDTVHVGNSNQGHRFCGSDDENADDYWWNGCPPPGRPDGPKSTKGVIGPRLTDADRVAIMEFLKSLPPRPVPRGGG